MDAWINFIRIPTGFLFEVFHFLSVRFHAGRLIWILICWPAVTAPLRQIRSRSQSCFLGSIKAYVTCWRLPGLGAAFPGTYWQGNHAVTTRPPSIVSLICQREASYQPLSFIQWPWWRPVWVTETSGRASRKELWEHPWSSDLYCDWLNRTCLFNYAWGGHHFRLTRGHSHAQEVLPQSKSTSHNMPCRGCPAASRPPRGSSGLQPFLISQSAFCESASILSARSDVVHWL